MPKKNAKVQKTNELDGREFFAAIDLIEKEKGIPKAYMLDKITQALVSAYKRDHEGAGDNVSVEADEAAGTVRMFVKKDVVEEVDNPCTEMSLEMARSKLPQAQLGDVIRIEIKTRDFGRIAAQTARQVIIQGMREAERGMIYDEFSSKEHEILTGVVTRIDPRSGAASLRIGSGNEATEAFLAPGEQVKGETYTEGMRLRVYVVEVRRSTKGPQVLISPVFIRAPLAVLLAVIQVQHRRHRIHAEPVHMKMLDPKQRIRNKEILHLRLAIVKDLCSPVRMLAFSRIRILKCGCAVKISQSVRVSRKMRGYPVKDHTDIVPVQVIDHIREIFRCAIP